MQGAPATDAADQADLVYRRQLREMNEALLVSSVRQQVVTEQAQKSEGALRQLHDELRSYAEDLSRFNRVAVGRELRMIELKKEVNELLRRQGQVARYPLDFEPDIQPADAEISTAVPNDDHVPLETVLRTDELLKRPSRPPDYEAENRALARLAQALADSPRTILQELADTILEHFQVGSAGISLLSRDETRFYWPAIAGAWRPQTGGSAPRNPSPSGEVLDRNAPQLFAHFERRYPRYPLVKPSADECLFVPFYVGGRAVGTIWASTHDAPLYEPKGRKFDAEDLRQLESLGRFASSAYQAMLSFGAEEQRHAALNLMEDAVQMQEALRNSEGRYRHLFESSKDGILILDADKGSVSDANPFFAEMAGRPREEFLGKELWQFGLLKDAAAGRAMLQELKENGYVHYDNLPLEAAAGRQVDVEIVANAYREDHGPVIQCNVRDITARRKLENKTIEQAKSLADLHRRKDEFLAMLSHELRNPMAAVRVAVDLLRRQRQTTKMQKEAHGIIERQVARLTRLVDDLLEISRITAGRIHLQKARIDLRSVVRRAVEATRSQCEEKSQSIDETLPKQPIWMHGDPVRLEQVVSNLLNNASKYSDRNGTIRVGLAQKEGDAVLRVRDNGMGIAPEMLPRIFDLFTQADQSLDRSQGGLGIGLALVQSLVRMHRGTVEAISALGQGSEFIVSLPVAFSVAPPATSPVERVDAPARSLRVLVVDDNVDFAKGTALLVREIGHDARLAHDGASAVQAALEYLPEVVLLDIGLPVVNGIQVAKWIRQEPALSNVVLIALTGYGQESVRRRSRAAGFDHHLVKPVEFAKMQSILSTVAEAPS